ncbi:peptide chain release factor N(5)-glutamine methyltransferase [Mycoplasmopsis sturni]|uniref:peptide chain release factor N(5)-glutamine methyltransferase n=1 Tax=Mycoplasmopsis sturni TaxID=39047 RepID=UPI000562E8F9|nr:peptide chain release factor N(5)-glutamine methyltransferase [Mycoplasmopsis sturni]
MPTIEDLLLEKRRYGLKQEVSDLEKKQLQQGIPVQKIIGYVDLANVRIDVNYDVLIPRYETEELVYLVIEHLKKSKQTSVLDLCSGSGFIGIAIKYNLPNLSVIASDISKQAILATSNNADLNDVKIDVIHSDLFTNINQKFDVIVSNPPYISHQEKLSPSVLNFEPHLALFANQDGLEFYLKIIQQAPNFLNPGGTIFFEINPFHLDFWTNLQKEYQIKIYNDISQKPRFVKIQF